MRENGGKVAGKVSFKGAAPAPKTLPITKDTRCSRRVDYLLRVDYARNWPYVETGQ